MKILESEGVRKVYFRGQNKVHALNGVTFSLFPGEFVCISGRSGSGKTTLLNCVGTLETVTQGKVFLEGTSIQGLPENGLVRLRRNFFGFVFQQPRLFPYLSVTDNVAIPLVYRGMRWKEARRRAQPIIGEVGLAARADYQARLLSGGEAERAAIARAVVYAPKILLADEPTGELDSVTSKSVVDLLLRQAKQGTAVMVVSHDPIAEEKADRVLRLEDGRLI